MICFCVLISKRVAAVSLLFVLFASCRTANLHSESTTRANPTAPAPAAAPGRMLPLNLSAGTQVLYEVQLRSANACDPDVGADWQRQACRSKLAPTIHYRAAGMSCSTIDSLERIKLGTIEDMLEDTADYRRGITLRYIQERVGATMIWVMPMFPNNDIESIPDACDNLGSPYAVRDYMHAAGTLSRGCIQASRDEYSAEPCWGNDSFDAFIQEAHRKGLKVMLDVAFNHLGHGYQMYDYEEFRSINDRIQANEDLNRLWNFDATYDENLVRPQLLDSSSALMHATQNQPSRSHELAALQAKCPLLRDQNLVIAFNAWRNALAWERENFPCSDATNLERSVTGFFMGANRLDPSTSVRDTFTNNWRDVRFVFHNENNPLKQHEFVRNREYLFRVLNYWTARGVDGFRLDHATDGDSKLSPNVWNYIAAKTNYYAEKRGQKRPLLMAEEFGDQLGMDRVVDLMTEGYVFGMNARGGGEKNSSHVEGVLGGMSRFPGQTYVMTALETHDEPRLTEGTGFNRWTGAGFWGIGATTRSAPMLLMGQEFGETYGLGFRRSDFLRGRFIDSPTYTSEGDALTAYYRTMISGRLANENRALYSQNYALLRAKPTNAADERIFAQAKWSDDGNVVFVFHNLWEQDVQQSFFIPPAVADAMLIKDPSHYRLYDILSNQQLGPCRTGADLKWDLPVIMGRATRAQWLRLEICP